MIIDEYTSEYSFLKSFEILGIYDAIQVLGKEFDLNVLKTIRDELDRVIVKKERGSDIQKKLKVLEELCNQAKPFDS